MKKGKAISSIILILCIAAVLALPIMFTIHFLFSTEEPELAYAEIPVEMTYEFKGETITVKEVYVLEYGGRGMGAEIWDRYILSTGDEGIILYEEDGRKVVCKIGHPSYKDVVAPYVYLLEEKRGFLFFKETEYTSLSEKELYEEFGIKIISWTTDSPLKDYWD